MWVFLPNNVESVTSIKGRNYEVSFTTAVLSVGIMGREKSLSYLSFKRHEKVLLIVNGLKLSSLNIELVHSCIFNLMPFL